MYLFFCGLNSKFGKYRLSSCEKCLGKTCQQPFGAIGTLQAPFPHPGWARELKYTRTVVLLQYTVLSFLYIVQNHNSHSVRQRVDVYVHFYLVSTGCPSWLFGSDASLLQWILGLTIHFCSLSQYPVRKIIHWDLYPPSVFLRLQFGWDILHQMCHGGQSIIIHKEI